MKISITGGHLDKIKFVASAVFTVEVGWGKEKELGRLLQFLSFTLYIYIKYFSEEE